MSDIETPPTAKPSGPSDTEKAHILVDHYHKTFDLAARIWQRRNKTFLVLVGVVGVTALLTFNTRFTTSLATLLAKAGASTDVSNLPMSDFPANVVNGMLLLAVFFLTMNLYQNTVTMIRYYNYIGLVEAEIRRLLGVAEGSFVFARESRHYWKERPQSFWVIRYSYVFILGALLLFLYGLRLLADIPTYFDGDIVPLFIDIFMGVPTAFVFLAYVRHSFVHDSTGEQKT